MYRGKNTRSIYNYVTRKESVASSRSKDGKPASTGGTDFSHNRYSTHRKLQIIDKGDYHPSLYARSSHFYTWEEKQILWEL